MTKTIPFIPSSFKLTAMVRAAEAKFDHAREQALLAKEARIDARMVRSAVADAEQRRRRALYGVL